MKPWWKKMTIIACCILCAGVVLSGIGWALGGKIVTLGDSLPDHSAAAVQRAGQPAAGAGRGGERHAEGG